MSAREVTCIIGWPVSHSLSPAIHSAAFDASGLEWIYIPIGVRPDGVEEGMQTLRTLDVVGANVTMPHKRAVVPHLKGLEGDAMVLETVNTLVRADGGFIGHNTDGAGFLDFLDRTASWEPMGKRALVLGAGGAARAVAYALARTGARVFVEARRKDQAHELVGLHKNIQDMAWGDRVEADLIVNATAAREGLPLDTLGFGQGTIAVDLIYPPPDTAFVQAARAAGSIAFDGLGMLVHQAGLSFRIWTGLEPPLDVMSAAAQRALALRAAG
jgi:shikimate dehydrogenase